MSLPSLVINLGPEKKKHGPQKDRALLFYLQFYYINRKYPFGTYLLAIYMPSQHEHSRFRLVSAY